MSVHPLSQLPLERQLDVSNKLLTAAERHGYSMARLQRTMCHLRAIFGELDDGDVLDALRLLLPRRRP